MGAERGFLVAEGRLVGDGRNQRCNAMLPRGRKGGLRGVLTGDLAPEYPSWNGKKLISVSTKVSGIIMGRLQERRRIRQSAMQAQESWQTEAARQG